MIRQPGKSARSRDWSSLIFSRMPCFLLNQYRVSPSRQVEPVAQIWSFGNAQDENQEWSCQALQENRQRFQAQVSFQESHSDQDDHQAQASAARYQIDESGGRTIGQADASRVIAGLFSSGFSGESDLWHG